MVTGTLVGRSAPPLPSRDLMTRPGLLIAHDAGTTTVEPGGSLTFGRTRQSSLKYDV